MNYVVHKKHSIYFMDLTYYRVIIVACFLLIILCNQLIKIGPRDRSISREKMAGKRTKGILQVWFQWPELANAQTRETRLSSFQWPELASANLRVQIQLIKICKKRPRSWSPWPELGKEGGPNWTPWWMIMMRKTIIEFQCLELDKLLNLHPQKYQGQVSAEYHQTKPAILMKFPAS